MSLQVARQKLCGWPVDRTRGQLGVPVDGCPPSTGTPQWRCGYAQDPGPCPHKTPFGAQACAPNLQNKRPQSYPQGVDDENGVRLHLLSPTDINVTGLCI